MPTSQRNPGVSPGMPATEVFGTVFRPDIVTAEVFFFHSPLAANEPTPQLLSSCRLGGVSVMSVPFCTTVCRRREIKMDYLLCPSCTRNALYIYTLRQSP